MQMCECGYQTCKTPLLPSVRQAKISNRWWAILEKWVPYSQRYLFNAIPDTNHNANPTNPNHYSKGNPNPTNPNTRYRCE